VAGLLVPVWPPWGRGRFDGPRDAAVVAWPIHNARDAAVGAWPVPWAPCVRRVSVAGPLGPILLP